MKPRNRMRRGIGFQSRVTDCDEPEVGNMVIASGTRERSRPPPRWIREDKRRQWNWTCLHRSL